MELHGTWCHHGCGTKFRCVRIDNNDSREVFFFFVFKILFIYRANEENVFWMIVIKETNEAELRRDNKANVK